jgi:peptidoglycan/LPS O-acetylase OafA/YrhL
VWPLADGLASLLIAYAVTAALNYLVARATWHLVERRAQDLAHRLTSAASDRSTIRPAIAATASGLR